jgi:shikimate kinase
VVLIGFTGAGKTRVGGIVAARLGRVHLDVDELVEQRIGPIPAFLATQGALAFRSAERAFIRECVPRAGAVVSTGAGTVMPPPTRRLLCLGARVFFLDVPAELLARRLAAMPPQHLHRPDLLRADPVLAIEAELAQRRPLYEKLGIRIDGSRAPEVVAADLLARLATCANGS